jgi:hypothetical protein
VRRGVYPGSFDPLTIAHVAIARSAIAACALDVLDFALSQVPLGKANVASLEERAAAIERAGWPVRVVDGQWLADIAEGYDVVVLGADKWAQVLDVSFYGDSAALRDAAVARLPHVAVVPRHGLALPSGPGVTVLGGLGVDDVSSTTVREGRDEWRA